MEYIKERKPLLEVIALFLLIIGSLLAYSLWDKPLSLNVEIKQTRMKAFLNLEPQEDILWKPVTEKITAFIDKKLREDSLAKADSINQTANKGNKAKADATKVNNVPAGSGNLETNLKIAKKRGVPLNVVMPAGVNTNTQHILLAGDSMAGAAGLEYGFRKYAMYNGHRLTVISQPSSTTALWSQQKKLKAAIATYKPTFIIIGLGANELFVRDIPQRKKYIRDILKQAGNIPVIWVGPPNWRKDTGINAAIRSIVGKDRFFLSEHIKMSRQYDGIHPDIKGSVTWTDTLTTWIMYASKHKIRLINPIAARIKLPKKDKAETGKDSTNRKTDTTSQK
ncbi:hypothetical protein [uncultured Microscilla sp.]|uniref:hypothetical protein n=1 Tax=uncultured Microscilla sp. TaxID=432653 RepID=UPI002620E730|nr:hypothetical protein [uncultured Microscilla sp.]